MNERFDLRIPRYCALAMVSFFICARGAAQQPGYAGSEKCRTCHAEMFSSFENSPHWKLKVDQQPTPGMGCESCHGPGAEHAASGDPTKIFSFRHASAQDASSRCLACHQFGQEHSNFLRSAHKTNDVSCIECHSPHYFKTPQFILRRPQPQLCYGCHTEVAAQFALPFHHRVEEKLVRCTDCHNQHGGFLRAQLRANPAQDSVCLNCHSDKMGPFVFEHAPQRSEGCTGCHVPHGSVNSRLLKRSQVNLLCLECHTVVFGSAVRDLPGFHDQAAQFQACTLCHQAIHGSNFSRMLLK
jgi:DmsE family decaheme c-type cytochrome